MPNRKLLDKDGCSCVPGGIALGVAELCLPGADASEAICASRVLLSAADIFRVSNSEH